MIFRSFLTFSSADYTFRSGSISNNSDSFGNTSNNNGSSTLYQHMPLNLPEPPEINNNNNRIQMGGVQFIPSRLPSGEFALVMPNSGNSSEQWKPFYPVESLPLRQNAIDLNDTLPRSAFSNVTKMTKHLNTSPLSPASSMSSNDDSLSINQIDLQTSAGTSSPHRTPQKCLSAFPTPPSGGSITMIPTSHSSQLQNSTITSATTLQQQHVTSTTEQLSLKIRPLSLDLCLKENDSDQTIDHFSVAKKRSYSSESPQKKSDGSGNNSNNNEHDGDDDEPMFEVTKSEPKDSTINSDESNNDDQSESCNGDMWRPW